MSIDTQSNGGKMNRWRPGPFGPAWALLPKNQQPLVLEGSTSASDAVEGGCHITKATILGIYDEMAESIRTGQPYETLLDPPPAPPTGAHHPHGPVGQRQLAVTYPFAMQGGRK